MAAALQFPSDLPAAVQDERAECARAVCPRCRFGHAVHPGESGFYHDVNVGAYRVLQRCDATPIWERGRA